MRALALRLALLPLLLAASARAADLAGLWTVEGSLPSGETYVGWATLSPRGDEWELTARAEASDGRTLAWRARGSLEGQRLTLVRGGSGAGVVGALGGAGAGEAVSAVYELAADGRLFTGQVDLPGPEGVAKERYALAGTPAGRFDRPRLSLRRGESVEVALSFDPPEALAVAFVGGARPSQVSVARPAPGRVLLRGRAPGSTALLLRLGAHGPVLARLPIEVRPSVVEETLARARALAAAGKKPLVIFDLDDTLFDTRPRTLSILKAYPGEPRLAALRLDQIAHGLPETLGHAGFSAAELESPLVEKIRRFWSQRFFADESLRLDAPIPGSVAFVQALAAAGARPVYLTGRAEKARALSLEVLQATGFPEGSLFLKPMPGPGQAKEATPAFKARIARGELPQLGVVVAAFDNEPANCNAFRDSVPADAAVVFLDTIYPDDSPELVPGIETVPDFLE